MPTYTRERDIEKYLTNLVKLYGGICYKFISPGNGGVPDRLVLLPDGRAFFVEVKTQTGVVSAIQKQQIARISKLGHTVYIIRSTDDADALIKREFYGVSREVDVDQVLDELMS